MYVCPICNRNFQDKEAVARHSLQCWRENNPNIKSTPAPRSPDKEERTINDDVLNFFASFKGD